MATIEKDTARSQARAQLDTLEQMVERLQHAQTCIMGEECDEIDIDNIEDLLGTVEDDKAVILEQYHDEDDAQDMLWNDPLEVRQFAHDVYRCDEDDCWQCEEEQDETVDVKPTQYEILLCTGGPAVRIVGDLDKYQQPETAILEYQDWFTEWETYPTFPGEEDNLKYYASQFIA